jgi:hypothetical protein
LRLCSALSPAAGDTAIRAAIAATTQYLLYGVVELQAVCKRLWVHVAAWPEVQLNEKVTAAVTGPHDKMCVRQQVKAEQAARAAAALLLLQTAGAQQSGPKLPV